MDDYGFVILREEHYDRRLEIQRQLDAMDEISGDRLEIWQAPMGGYCIHRKKRVYHNWNTERKQEGYHAS